MASIEDPPNLERKSLYLSDNPGETQSDATASSYAMSSLAASSLFQKSWKGVDDEASQNSVMSPRTRAFRDKISRVLRSQNTEQTRSRPSLQNSNLPSWTDQINYSLNVIDDESAESPQRFEKTEDSKAQKNSPTSMRDFDRMTGTYNSSTSSVASNSRYYEYESPPRERLIISPAASSIESTAYDFEFDSPSRDSLRTNRTDDDLFLCGARNCDSARANTLKKVTQNPIFNQLKEKIDSNSATQAMICGAPNDDSEGVTTRRNFDDSPSNPYDQFKKKQELETSGQPPVCDSLRDTPLGKVAEPIMHEIKKRLDSNVDPLNRFKKQFDSDSSWLGSFCGCFSNLFDDDDDNSTLYTREGDETTLFSQSYALSFDTYESLVDRKGTKAYQEYQSWKRYNEANLQTQSDPEKKETTQNVNQKEDVNNDLHLTNEGAEKTTTCETKGQETRELVPFSNTLATDTKSYSIFDVCSNPGVEDMSRTKLIPPSKNVSSLLEIINTPLPCVDVENEKEVNYEYDSVMKQRQNAVGILKAMTEQPENRIKLCMTAGVLTSLVSVLHDVSSDCVDTKSENHVDFLVCRKRVLGAMLNMALAEENAVSLYHHPDLITELSLILESARDESLILSLMILTRLVKETANQLDWWQNPGTFDAILSIIRTAATFDSDSNDESSKDGGNLLTIDEELEDLDNPETDTTQPEAIDQNDLLADSVKSETKDQNDLVTDTMKSEDKDQGDAIKDTMKSVGKDQGDAIKDTMKLEDKDQGDAIKDTMKLEDKDRSDAMKDTMKPKTDIISKANKMAFAVLFQLCKSKGNASILWCNEAHITTLVNIAMDKECTSNIAALMILAQPTTYPDAQCRILFNTDGIMEAIIEGTKSPNKILKKYACYVLQNITSNHACIESLPEKNQLVGSLFKCALDDSCIQTQLSALKCLRNLASDSTTAKIMNLVSYGVPTLKFLSRDDDPSVNADLKRLAIGTLGALATAAKSQ